MRRKGRLWDTSKPWSVSLSLVPLMLSLCCSFCLFKSICFSQCQPFLSCLFLCIVCPRCFPPWITHAILAWRTCIGSANYVHGWSLSNLLCVSLLLNHNLLCVRVCEFETWWRPISWCITTGSCTWSRNRCLDTVHLLCPWSWHAHKPCAQCTHIYTLCRCLAVSFFPGRPPVCYPFCASFLKPWLVLTHLGITFVTCVTQLVWMLFVQYVCPSMYVFGCVCVCVITSFCV